jgi:hypothetical protein
MDVGHDFIQMSHMKYNFWVHNYKYGDGMEIWGYIKQTIQYQHQHNLSLNKDLLAKNK